MGNIEIKHQIERMKKREELTIKKERKLQNNV
jgi:hypothetical protein